eukprot:g3704.t1
MREHSSTRSSSHTLRFYLILLSTVIPSISLPSVFIAGVLFLTTTVVSQPLESDTCSCTDVPPDERYSCTEQQSFGKCDEIWMTSSRPDLRLPSGFCQTTCGRCDCNLPVIGTEACQCDDVPPSGDFTCTQQQQFGQCQQSWMINAPQELQLSNGFCASTCGRCVCQTQSSPVVLSDDCNCTDLSPPSEEGYTCEEQRNFGKCTSSWMRASQPNAPEGFCQYTCGFCSCPGAPVVNGTPRPVFLGDQSCTCSDFSPPGSSLSCAEQRQLGKCLADWMRNPGTPEEGYCQITCGLCPCNNPTIVGSRPEMIPSFPDLSPGQPIPIETSLSDQVAQSFRREDSAPSVTGVPVDESPVFEAPVVEIIPDVERVPAVVESPETEIIISPELVIPAPEEEDEEVQEIIEGSFEPEPEPETLVEILELPPETDLEPTAKDEIPPTLEIEVEPVPEPEDVVDDLELPFIPEPESSDEEEIPRAFEIEVEPVPEPEDVIDTLELPAVPEMEPTAEDEIPPTLEIEVEPVPEPEDVVDDLELPSIPEPEPEPSDEEEEEIPRAFEIEVEPVPEPEDEVDDLELPPVPEPESEEDIIDSLLEIPSLVPEPEQEEIDEEEIEATLIPDLITEPAPEPEIEDLLDDLEPIPDEDYIDDLEETSQITLPSPLPEVTPNLTVPEEEPLDERNIAELEDFVPVQEPMIETEVPIIEPEEEIADSLDRLDAPVVPQMEPIMEPEIDDLVPSLIPAPRQEPETEEAPDLDTTTAPPLAPETDEETVPDLDPIESIEETPPMTEVDRIGVEAEVTPPSMGNFTEAETEEILTDLNVTIESVNDYEDPLPRIQDSIEVIREQEPNMTIVPRRGRKLKQSVIPSHELKQLSTTHPRSIKQLLSENRTSALFNSVDFSEKDEEDKERTDPGQELLSGPPASGESEGERGLPCNSIEQLLDSPLGVSQFGILSTLIRKSGLLEELRSPNLQSTMFVAMDSAFDQMPKSITLEQLQNDNSIHTINFIRKLILFNIVPGVYRAKDFKNNLVLETLYGSPVSVASGGNQSVNSSELTTVKIVSRGGSWYAVGGPWFARIEVPDIGLCSSVVHLVDRVLWPPDDFNFLPTDESGKSCNTITGLLESVVGVTHFSILSKLLKKAGLEDELRNPSLRATIFAPVDKAFRNLPEPFSIDRMLNEDSPKVINELQKLLLFHVVPGRVGTEDFNDGLPLVTFLASFYTLVNKKGELIVESDTNGTKIITNDIEARIIVPDVGVCQSIIHWIDAVLLPTWNDAVVEVLTKNQTQLQASNNNNNNNNEDSTTVVTDGMRGLYTPSTLELYSFTEPTG